MGYGYFTAKKSDETLEDIIEYVQVKMYHDLVSLKKSDGSSGGESESEEAGPHTPSNQITSTNEKIADKSNTAGDEDKSDHE